MSASQCNICKSPFDDTLHLDCGGDCLLCMAEAGDPDCALQAIKYLKTALAASLAHNKALADQFESYVDGGRVCR
jgi:hypothetical protein